MRVVNFLPFLVSLCWLPFVSAKEIQNPLREDHLSSTTTTPFRIAIIGAGAAGSSAAYHLSLFANTTIPTIPISISIFDSASHAGGRSTTVDALSNPSYPVELGASIFVKINHILYNASIDFGLAASSASRRSSSDFALGVWDGTQFVFKQASDDDTSGGWRDWKGYWDIAKLLWRYGLSPIRTRSLTKEVVGRFLRFYDPPIFPFSTLDSAVEAVDLQQFIGTTGVDVLQNAGVGVGFQREIIQASTRVNYAQNLAQIHGLETMVCMATDSAMSIEGGNWQIFQRMVEASGAKFFTNTTVTHLERFGNRTYSLTSTMHNTEAETTSSTTQHVDAVILAAPLQFAHHALSPSLRHIPNPIPYVRLHVTLLTSPHRLSPGFFGLESQNLVPDMILTTLPEDTSVPSNARGVDAVGPAGFWSVSLLREIQEPGQRTQFLYKVFSPSPLTGTFVSQLLDFDYTNASLSNLLSALPKSAVSWYHEKIWDSYPYETPRTTFEKIRLDGNEGWEGRGVWYTSGIESFISTMETSALMGKNVARLMLDEIVDARRKI